MRTNAEKQQFTAGTRAAFVIVNAILSVGSRMTGRFARSGTGPALAVFATLDVAIAVDHRRRIDARGVGAGAPPHVDRRAARRPRQKTGKTRADADAGAGTGDAATPAA